MATGTNPLGLLKRVWTRIDLRSAFGNATRSLAASGGAGDVEERPRDPEPADGGDDHDQQEEPPRRLVSTLLGAIVRARRGLSPRFVV
jgi:hypothetical protein